MVTKKNDNNKKILLRFNSAIYYTITNLQTECNFFLIQPYILISDN